MNKYRIKINIILVFLNSKSSLSSHFSLSLCSTFIADPNNPSPHPHPSISFLSPPSLDLLFAPLLPLPPLDLLLPLLLPLPSATNVEPNVLLAFSQSPRPPPQKHVKNVIFLSNIFYIYFHMNKYRIKINIILVFLNSKSSLSSHFSLSLCSTFIADPNNPSPHPHPSISFLSPPSLDLLFAPLLPLPPLDLLLPLLLPLPSATNVEPNVLLAFSQSPRPPPPPPPPPRRQLSLHREKVSRIPISDSQGFFFFFF